MIRWRDPRAPLAAAAAFGAAGFAAALLAGGPALLTGAIAGLLAALLAAASLLVASTKLGEHRSTAMGARWMGSGAIVWAAGVGVRPIADSSSVAVSFADLLVLLGAVLTAGGVLIAARRRLPATVVLRHVTGAYLCAASLFVVAWVVLLRHVYADAADPAMFTFAMLPPMITLLVTCAVIPSVITSRSAAWPLGLAGIGVLATTTVAGVAAAIARLTGGVPPTWSIMIAPVAFLLLAAVPWGRRPADPDARPDRSAIGNLIAMVPMALVAVATCTLLVHLAGGQAQTPVTGVVVLIASVVLLLVIRLFVLAAANMRLRTQVSLGDRQLRELAESSGDVVLICDYEGVVYEIGVGVEVTYGYRPEALVGGTIFDYIHPEDVPGIQAALRAMGLDDEGATSGACLIACRVRAADGTWRPTESVATRHVGGEDQLLVTIRDVSDEEALRNQVAHLTFHDGVTGLPNRSYFEERTREVLSGRMSGNVAVIFLDLDGFTSVNDSVGHASGDYLLGQAARRLRGAVRPDDTLARWGGDEFAVLLETGGEAQIAVDLAERLVRAVSQEPFRVADRDVALTASVGVAFAEDDMPSGDLIRNADVAMARAKELGGRRVEVFAAQMHADVVRRLELAADLQRALIEHQFAIEYQPVVDLATSRVTAVEA
ncbi:MAG TPA: diguanylate cyclase, partial [Nonomuraea sp.]|nr:diguanylate cyclase [Nonomuraea sp.]